MKNVEKKLVSDQTNAFLKTLADRFEKNSSRHPQLVWEKVQEKLQAQPVKLWSLFQMESTGGEPDVVGFDTKHGEFIFFDCSPQSPTGRRSLCYDQQAWESRKAHKPKNSAQALAEEMGVEILTEVEYRLLQELGDFDTTTSSWIATPQEIRNLGGALFCDRRYNSVFVYHNGAESYYASRGFRASLKI